MSKIRLRRVRATVKTVLQERRVPSDRAPHPTLAEIAVRVLKEVRP
jgi:hypothetical protein